MPVNRSYLIAHVRGLLFMSEHQEDLAWCSCQSTGVTMLFLHCSCHFSHCIIEGDLVVNMWFDVWASTEVFINRSYHNIVSTRGFINRSVHQQECSSTGVFINRSIHVRCHIVSTGVSMWVMSEYEQECSCHSVNWSEYGSYQSINRRNLTGESIQFITDNQQECSSLYQQEKACGSWQRINKSFNVIVPTGVSMLFMSEHQQKRAWYKRER